MQESRVRQELRRFGVEFLCLLLLLYGSPLQALAESSAAAATVPSRSESSRETPEEPSRIAAELAKLWETLGKADFLHRGGETGGIAPKESIHVAQATGPLPLPPQLMAALLASSSRGQAGPPRPPGLGSGEVEPTPPAEIARLAGKSATEEILLLAGWNLISIPEEPADPDPAVVFAAVADQVAKVEAFDACDVTDPWKEYDPADAVASDLAAVDQRKGMWVKATAAAVLPSDGTLPAATTLELCEGWNLIGFPAGEPRHPYVALSPIAGKWQRVFAYDAFDPEDPWEIFDPAVPDWANDLRLMHPGRGYWVLMSEAATLEIRNQGPPPTVAIASPADLAVATQPTDVIGTVASDRLSSWTLAYRPIGDGDAVTLATGNAPVTGGALATFDPTLLLNGLYQLELTATDVQGQQVAEQVAISVEGQMKIGHFTLSFVDLAIPVSGLDIEVVRTYDSRDKQQRDFGAGWSLDVRQGSYRNNRPPGDGWQLQTGFLPCDTVLESKSHLTVVRLSDQEVYRFALKLADGAPTQGGCFATARFDYVGGPLPGTSLEILGNAQVFYENGSTQVVDANTFGLFEPEDVRLTTRDGRIFELDLTDGVTRLEDLNGNQLSITPAGIIHSSGRGIAFERDAEGRIERITDPMDRVNSYGYDAAGDLTRFTDRADAVTRFTYDDHRLRDIEDPRGVKSIRNEYDAVGRLVRHVDAYGKVIELGHDRDSRREVITNRLGASRILEYDTRGNVVRETDELGKVTTRTFDGRDNLLTETDPLGRTTTYTYTPENDLETVKDPLGKKTSFTYDSRGQISTVTHPSGGVTTHVYEGNDLTSTTNALGKITTSTYDPNGNLQTTVDALGHVTTFEYDTFGNLTRETDALGNVTEYTYDAAGNRLTESRSRTLPDGTTETLLTAFTYDDLDRLTVTTAADGGTTSTAYDLLGKVLQQTGPLGRSTTMAYDLMGRLISTSNPDGTTETRSYDAEGRLLAQVDRAGRTTSFAYDAAGRLKTTTYPDGATTSNAYDDAGQLATTTDARGNTTTFTYDGAGRRTGVVDPLGAGPTFAYDDNGNQTSITDARGFTRSFTYDALKRLTMTTYPDDTTTAVIYDALGRRVAETDQAGLTTEFGYDALGRLMSVTGALDQVTIYTYDEVGNRLTQTDANGHTTHFEYDALGRQTARILPDDARESMIYYADGTLASRTDFNGATRTFEYDDAQRLVRRVYPDGTNITFTYSPAGERASVTDARGTTTYTYDDRDRLIEKVDPTDYKLGYTYDREGNRTHLTASVGTQILTTSYTYDALNRIETVTDPQGGVTTLGYDDNGNRKTLAHPNGVTTTYVYDALNRLSHLETANRVGTALQTYAYTLSAAGNRTRIDEHDGTSRHYQYDDLYRLIQDRVADPAGVPVYQRDFTYDPVGNRLTQVIDEGSGPTTITSTYDARDRLLAANTTSYGWDTNGNLTSRMEGDATSYSWDSNNRLTSVALNDGTIVQTTYDADGNRVRTSATRPGQPTMVLDYLVDTTGSLSHVVADVANGSIQTHYVRAAGQLIEFYRPTSETRAYYHADGLGSVRAISDQAAVVTDSYAFTAFGDLQQRSGSTSQPYQFAGEPYDPNVRFYYNRARWLDVRTGRFVGVDPFAGFPLEPIALHRYLYSNLNPVNLIDPSGLSAGFSVSEMLTLALAVGALFAVGGYLNAKQSGASNSEAAIEAAQAFLIGAGVVGVVYGIFWAGTAVFIWATAGATTTSYVVWTSFRGFRYYAVDLQRPLTVYRYYERVNRVSGPWWTPDRFASRLEVINRLALHPDFQNNASRFATGIIPAGTRVLVGVVGRQGSLPGGGTQIFVPDPSVVRVVASGPFP